MADSVKTTAMQCPTCHRELGASPEKEGGGPRDPGRYKPFCSERCKMVDLGRWISEDYRVASDELPSLEDGAESLED